MFRTTFYHSTLKKVVAGFGKIFSNICVVRVHANGTEKERIKVPLTYGPSEKFLVRLEEDPDLARGFAYKMPLMSFQIEQVQYDATRKLNTIKKNVQPVDGDQKRVIRQYQGVPYKLTIKLSILSKYIDDANQIVEQILPYFTPAYTITINSVAGMNYQDDVAITLSSISLEDNYESDWKERRNIIWTISFDVNVVFYGPVVEKNVVTKVQTDFHSADVTDDLSINTILPGIPRISRVSLEPSNPKDTYQNDDFGYTTTFESFDDGDFVFEPITGTDVPAAARVDCDSLGDCGKIGRPKLV